MPSLENWGMYNDYLFASECLFFNMTVTMMFFLYTCLFFAPLVFVLFASMGVFGVYLFSCMNVYLYI